jgi:hypothetical protein
LRSCFKNLSGGSFYRISKEVEEDKREFSLGITSLADSTAIGKKKSVPVLQNRDAPDTDFAGYPVCRISGLPDIRSI